MSKNTTTIAEGISHLSYLRQQLTTTTTTTSMSSTTTTLSTSSLPQWTYSSTMDRITHPSTHYRLPPTNTTTQWITSSAYSNKTTSTTQSSSNWRSTTVLMATTVLCQGMVTATTQWTTQPHNLDQYRPQHYSTCAMFLQSFHHLV